VSHIPQRKEKDCLNCGTIVHGRFCHTCGQENVIPKETFWHMVTHFTYDITHFDSKFFETLKDLVFKPGFLSREYMKGRRASYLHPVKMYVFTSAIFFLLFFSVFSDEKNFNMKTPGNMSGTERLAELAEIEERLTSDSSRAKKDPALPARLAKLEQMKDTTKPVDWEDFGEIESDFTRINIAGQSHKYTSVEEYDSVQRSLPKEERDGWFKKRLTRKEISINSRYRTNPEAAMEKLKDNILHKLPYMLFVSLPLFALILQVLYFRRKQFYYADHAVFTIHLYIFSFIVLLVVFSLSELQDWTGWSFLGWVIALMFITLNFYLYKAMRTFYGQGRFKTFIKYLMTAFISLMMMIFLLVIFFFFSAYEL
jgi:hypothetical protein